MPISTTDAKSAGNIPLEEKEDITDLYLAIYFDGTSNNMYFPQNKRNGLKKKDNDNFVLQKKQAESNHIIDNDRYKRRGNGNDKYSNVAILYSVSKACTANLPEKTRSPQVAAGYSIYIEGSGAEPIAGSDPIGAGFGVGKTGVVALVSKAIKLIYGFIGLKADKKIRKDVSVHFALFGFSRGATCARLMAHLITREKNEVLPREKEFEQYLKNNVDLFNNRVCFLDDFDPNKVSVDFLGVFDTVSSIGFLLKNENETNYGVNNFQPIQNTRIASIITKTKEAIDTAHQVTDTIANSVSTVGKNFMSRGIKMVTDTISDPISTTKEELLNRGIEIVTGAIADSVSTMIVPSALAVMSKQQKDNSIEQDNLNSIQDIELNGTSQDLYVNNLHNIGGADAWGDAYMNFHRYNVTDYGLFISQNKNKVKKAFQICAMDEFRENFALVNLGKVLSNNCSEIYIPGCHSDIGGGYMDDDTLMNYSLRRTINNTKTLMYKSQTNQKPSFANTIDISINGLKESGWLYEDKSKLFKKISKAWRGKLGSVKEDSIRMENGIISEDDSPSVITFKRFVKEGYSNIALLGMLHKASKELEKWPNKYKPFPENDVSSFIPKRFSIPKEIDSIGQKIISLCQTIGDGKRAFFTPIPDEYKELRNNYLHFTSTDKRYSGIAGNPRNIKERVIAIGANLGNPPNWKRVTIDDKDYYLLCRLMYNGDENDSSLNYLYDING